VQRSTSMLQQRSTAGLLAKSSSLTALKQTETPTIVAAEKKSLLETVWNDQTKLTIYLGIWYLGNIYYNIYNKKACNALGKNALGASNAHWALSALQLAFALCLLCPCG